MKKILSAAMLMVVIGSCGDDRGERTYDMPTVQDERPTQDPNANPTLYDTSARNVQDTTTAISYDTSTRKK